MKTRAFVTFTFGEKYENLCRILQESIEICSDWGLIIYRPEDFDIEFTPENWQPGYIYKFKILSCLKALNLYNEVVWLDTDCIVTKNIDKIWNYQITDYPLLPKHRFYNFVNWPHSKTNYTDPDFLKLSKEKIGCVENNFENLYLQACCMFFNKNCESFLRKVLSYFENYDNNVFPFGDETIINTLIWKNKYTKNLGDVFLCSHYFSPYILKSILKLKDKEDYPKLFNPEYKHKFPSDEDEDFILVYGRNRAEHNRIGILENNFENILFFHGSKMDYLHQEYLDCLKENL